MNMKHLATRSHVLQATREYFYQAGFYEVETPVRITAPALEDHIDTPPSGSAWLRASPELHMKRLLATGARQIFQIGPCFRSGECGKKHNPEFTLLEWYRTAADYTDILRDTEALLTHVLKKVTGQNTLVYQNIAIDLARPWHCHTVQAAFQTWAGWDPVASWDEERFNADMAELIEPSLPRDRPCVLTDYPAPAAALARLKHNDPRVAERWELYIGGLEIANAFSELCDPVAQRARFIATAQKRGARNQTVYPLDEPFLAALATGMPECGGIALGLDRLTMLLGDVADIAEIRPFCQRPGELIP